MSVGFAALDRAEPTSQRLFHDADQGLYRAKANGRARSGTIGDIGPGAPTQPRGSQELPDPIFVQADWDRLEESLRESNRATDEASSIIDSLQTTASIGFGYVDRDFRLLRINSMLAAVNGGTVEDQIGRRVADVVPALWPSLEPIYQHVIDSGEAAVNQEVSGPTATDPDRIHCWLTNLNPVSVSGDVIGIAMVVVDITERKQLEESQATLTRAVVRALPRPWRCSTPTLPVTKSGWHASRVPWRPSSISNPRTSRRSSWRRESTTSASCRFHRNCSRIRDDSANPR